MKKSTLAFILTFTTFWAHAQRSLVCVSLKSEVDPDDASFFMGLDEKQIVMPLDTALPSKHVIKIQYKFGQYQNTEYSQWSLLVKNAQIQEDIFVSFDAEVRKNGELYLSQRVDLRLNGTGDERVYGMFMSKRLAPVADRTYFLDRELNRNEGLLSKLENLVNQQNLLRGDLVFVALGSCRVEDTL